MTTVTENDLRELKEDIKEVNKKIDKLTETITQLVIGQVEIKTELREKLNSVNARLDSQDKAIQKIPDLAEKIGELKNWRTIALVVISGFITSLFWFFRTGKF